ncbi:RnfABCDGE type electron transport complex subunit G [Clostridium sp. MD294]|uniref:RnfABCDGE type electron transport complex subunit G n=1 Tax=Clostridium sp. MD294 TaxID=97138 RepID=UPI0002C97838|nr:RnfABCDGE type electron transport complex subunit G [Clostridium sp. MD294]NDO47296.1 RnfABCDGE type electron transport complex subunit G [Clostridium sp. MD294]USF29635.1 Na(+)-translocating ferredoxin:NAD(+) oxidoreductase complex subunit G [Clostridium sp. MD294]
MKDIARPAFVLLIITAVAAMLLGIVSETTKAAIEEQSAKTEAEAMAAVMPDEGVEFETLYDTANGDTIEGTIKKVAIATKGGETIGYVLTTAPSGFGGEVSTMVGVDMSGTVTGLRVLSHAETPGLGALATSPDFYEQFAGKSGNIQVTKDGGEIIPITSATITSRAVSDGANEAVQWVNANGGAN